MAVAKLQKASLFGAVMQQAVLGAKGAHRLVEKGAEILLEQGSGQQLSEFRQRSFQILLKEELCVLESGSQHSLIPSLHTTHTDTLLEIYLLEDKLGLHTTSDPTCSPPWFCSVSCGTRPDRLPVVHA